MELHQLEYFVAVTDAGSFTKAAERLHVSQPGVSAQIRRLERELGQELLDRSGRGVRPTEVGAAVLPYARQALRAADSLRHAVDEFAGLIRGHVSIGRVASMAFLDLPAILARFHQQHPAVDISMSEATTDLLLAALNEGTVDIAIIGAAGTSPPGIDTQNILEERIAAAVPHDHELARRSSIPISALAGFPLISLPVGTGLRAALDAATSAAGADLRVAFEASEPEALAQLAIHGLGVALVPPTFVTQWHADTLTPVEITGPEMHARIDLAWRAGGPSGPAARALTEHLRDAFASMTVTAGSPSDG
jgi:DNA-binding transcriptional LysR family regulator